MQLPLNVLLYKLSVNSNFETQNIDLSRNYDGIKLFDVDYVQEDLPYSFVCWNLRNVIPELKPFAYQNTLYVLRLIDAKADYTKFLNPEEEEVFRKSFRDVPFQCGISHTFFSLMDLKMADKQCKEAIRLHNLYKEEKKEFCEFKAEAVMQDACNDYQTMIAFVLS